MRPRLQTVADQVVAGHERRGVDWPGRLVLQVVRTVIDLFGVSRGGQGVGPV